MGRYEGEPLCLGAKKVLQTFLFFGIGAYAFTLDGGNSLAENSHHLSEGTSQHVQVAEGKSPGMGWVERLKGQTIVEDSLEGRPDRAAKVDWQHERLMKRMNHQMQADLESGSSNGSYNTMSMLHQYGAGGQDYLLASDLETEPVSIHSGRCPAGAPIEAFRYFGHQCRNYLESMVGLLSRVYVCPDQKY